MKQYRSYDFRKKGILLTVEEIIATNIPPLSRPSNPNKVSIETRVVAALTSAENAIIIWRERWRKFSDWNLAFSSR